MAARHAPVRKVVSVPRRSRPLPLLDVRRASAPGGRIIRHHARTRQPYLTTPECAFSGQESSFRCYAAPRHTFDRQQRTGENMVKRAFDVLASAAALVVLSPLMVVVGVLVRLKLRATPIFAQVRPGLHGQPFTLYKFRTMSNARDAQGSLLPDAQRLGAFGRFLRSTSLDELPELFNILRGDMSLVGPRPLLMHYLALYTPEQRRRQSVRPGLTGWAQVHGRNAITWEQRLALDVWYVDHHSLRLDLRILGKTVLYVLRRDGITQPGHATMEEFVGSDRH